MHKSLLPQARGDKKADLVLKNARILDVFQEEIRCDDLAIASGVILGWGDYAGHREIDLAGDYLTPAFIDPHLHIESSQVSVANFAREIIPRGITTIIADPHEIANVAGLEGIKYLLYAGRKLPWNFHLMLPSCVPATTWEESGSTLAAEDLAKLLPEKNIFGLGEVMDFPGVIQGQENIWSKLEMAEDYFIDGHAPEVQGRELNAYLLGNIRADHECTFAEEAREKVSRGMFIMIREGSVTKDLQELLPVVIDASASRFMFATDDRQPEDILEEGHLDHAVRLAISEGMKPERAYRLASLNPAQALGLNDLGSISPGNRADLLVLSELEAVDPKHVIKDGEFLVKDSKLQKSFTCDLAASSEQNTEEIGEKIKKRVYNSVNCGPIETSDFKIPAAAKYRVMEIKEDQIITDDHILEIKQDETLAAKMQKEDISRLAAVERHRATGKIGLGLVKGFNLQQGALATTISHDSHNIMVLGENSADMKIAVEELIAMQGGMAAVKAGEVVASLSLSIAGLMSDKSMETSAKKLKKLRRTAKSFGVNHPEPFMQLSFLSLPVIPELKLTVDGLFDVRKFEHVSLVMD